MKFVIRGSSLLEKHPSHLTESVSREDNFFWVGVDFGWFWKHSALHFYQSPILGQRRPTTNTYLFLGCLAEARRLRKPIWNSPHISTNFQFFVTFSMPILLCACTSNRIVKMQSYRWLQRKMAIAKRIGSIKISRISIAISHFLRAKSAGGRKDLCPRS